MATKRKRAKINERLERNFIFRYSSKKGEKVGVSEKRNHDRRVQVLSAIRYELIKKIERGVLKNRTKKGRRRARSGKRRTKVGARCKK